jgi:hypothetical protein
MPYYDVANLVTITDEYDRPNGLWLWNHKNHRSENTAPSLLQSCAEVSAALEVLPQTCAEVLAAPKFDYPTSQFL